MRKMLRMNDIRMDEKSMCKKPEIIVFAGPNGSDLIKYPFSKHRAVTFLSQLINLGLRKKLCKRYLTRLDKAKITGISLI